MDVRVGRGNGRKTGEGSVQDSFDRKKGNEGGDSALLSPKKVIEIWYQKAERV